MLFSYKFKLLRQDSLRWICVYKDCILPTSPHVWNNDYHVHIDDAARFGFLRKHIGDQITIDNGIYNYRNSAVRLLLI